MRNRLSRRAVVAMIGGASLLPLLPRASHALDVDQARTVIDQLIAEINGVINSGASESQMYGKFQAIFTRYADVNYIALSALGPAGRSATDAQKRAFVDAFTRYLAVKYGKRFREFIGGRVEVKSARAVKNFYEVTSVARLQGQSPFEVRWQVVERGGQVKFFNLIIEGVNMLAAERTEVGALLDSNGGNIDKMTAALPR